MADIFISYARKDVDTAVRLADSLSTYGWTVFWDRRLATGDRFAQTIASEVASAKCVITLWSRAAIASDWVADEAEEARKRNTLMPVFIERVDPPLGFRRIHAADLVGWKSNKDHPGFSHLIEDITRRLGRRSTFNTSSIAPKRTKLDEPEQPVRMTMSKRISLRGVSRPAACGAGGIAIVAIGIVGYLMMPTSTPPDAKAIQSSLGSSIVQLKINGYGGGVYDVYLDGDFAGKTPLTFSTNLGDLVAIACQRDSRRKKMRAFRAVRSEELSCEE